MWDTEKEIIVDIRHGQEAKIAVYRPYWHHHKSNRREAKITIYTRDYGGFTIEEAEKIHMAIGEAILIAKTLKLENPKKKPDVLK